MMAGMVALLVLFLVSLMVCHPTQLERQRVTRPGQGCPERCPDPGRLLRCAWGRVRDARGCCWECGNGEGRPCDPDPHAEDRFHGHCAEGLRCRVPQRGRLHPRSEEPPGPVCVCPRQEALCGSNGKTYENLCQLRAAQLTLGEGQVPTVAHHGPCRAEPVITSAPHDVSVSEGGDILLSCEVTSYPLASIQWWKDGRVLVFSDESNSAVQARGGPRPFELTGWLRIQAVSPAHAGVYTCSARNALGEASASARLQVPQKGSQLIRGQRRSRDGAYSSPVHEDDEDDEDYEGQPSGYMYL